MLQRLIFAAALVLFAAPAFAEIPVEACGAPPEAQLDTDPGGSYCNLHARRFAYSDEDKKFQKMLQERRKNYSAPQQKALHEYQDTLKARHDAYKPESAAALEGEIAGPPNPAANLNP